MARRNMTAHEEMRKRLEKEEDDPRERVPNSTFLDAATRRNLESFFDLEDSGIGEGQRDCSSVSAPCHQQQQQQQRELIKNRKMTWCTCLLPSCGFCSNECNVERKHSL